jgi:hypothetical protein
MSLPSAIYAVVSLEPGDGIVSVHRPGVGNWPMVALSESKAHEFLGLARELVRVTGRRLVLLRFEAPEVLAELGRDSVGKEG